MSLLSELIAQLHSLVEQSRDTRSALRGVRDNIEAVTAAIDAATQNSSNPLVGEGLASLATAVATLGEVEALLGGGETGIEDYISGPLLGGTASPATTRSSNANGVKIPAQRGSAPKPTKSHGTRQKRAGVTSGPVIFSIPRKLEGKLTGEHRRQAQEYVDAGNQALKDKKLSKTGRVRPSQNPTLKNQKELEARRERDRAEAVGEPYGDKVAAHLPDTTWAGTAQPPGGWGRHDEIINSSLGSQSDKYPVGYKPSGFELDSTWGDIVDDPDE